MTRAPRTGWSGCARGFTLLELMLVVAIVALVSSAVTLSWRDSDADLLEKEGLRLTAILESARAQSRASGAVVRWRATEKGFELTGLSMGPGDADRVPPPQRWTWLADDTLADVVTPPGAQTLQLGPEPLIPAQSLRLSRGERRLVLSTDGIGPFNPALEQP